MVDILQIVVLVEKSLGLKLVGIGPLLVVFHRRPHVHQDECVLRNEVISKGDVLRGCSRKKNRSGAVATHGFEQNSFDVRHLRSILVARWPILADHAIDLFVHLGLNVRVRDDVEDGPVERVRDRLRSGHEQILNERIEILLGEVPLRAHLVEIGIDDVAHGLLIVVRLALLDEFLDHAVAVLHVLEDVLLEPTGERKEIEAGNRGRLIEVLVDLVEEIAHVHGFEVSAEGERADVVAGDLAENVADAKG